MIKRTFQLVFAALAACVMLAPAMHAEELTVFDDSQVSVYVPIPTASYEEGGTRGQVIYPAEALTAMVGQTINGFTLYVNDEGCKMNGGMMRVSLGEVDSPVFTSETYFSGLTVVGRTSMIAGLTEVDFDFDEPYTYNGGNLVIDFYVQTPGESGAYNFTYFYGQYQQSHTAFSGDEYREFLPKATFYYGDKAQYAARTNPRNLTFSTIKAGQSEAITLYVKNIGLNAFTPSVTAPAPFSASIAQAALQPGEMAEVVVAFEPVQAGAYDGVLSVDCGEAGILEVPMTAVALEGGQEFTVCDGTDTNTKLPFNGVYFSDMGTYGQMIYPAAMLEGIKNSRIVALKFYAGSAMNLKDGTLQLSFTTTGQDAFETTTAITGMTALATTTLVKGQTEIEFNLDTPYEYNGGNLAVEVRVIDSKGNYATTNFVGTNTDYNAGMSLTHSQWSGDKAELVKFLPKATFSYQKEDGGIRGDVTQDGNVDINDVTALIEIILKGYPAPSEANCDLVGNVDINDVTMLIAYILNGQWPE